MAEPIGVVGARLPRVAIALFTSQSKRVSPITHEHFASMHQKMTQTGGIVYMDDA